MQVKQGPLGAIMTGAVVMAGCVWEREHTPCMPYARLLQGG